MDPARSHPASFPQTDHSEAEGQFQQQTVLPFGSTLFPGQSPAGGLGINSILRSSLSFSLLSSFINLLAHCHSSPSSSFTHQQACKCHRHHPPPLHFFALVSNYIYILFSPSSSSWPSSGDRCVQNLPLQVVGGTKVHKQPPAVAQSPQHQTARRAAAHFLLPHSAKHFPLVFLQVPFWRFRSLPPSLNKPLPSSSYTTSHPPSPPLPISTGLLCSFDTEPRPLSFSLTSTPHNLLQSPLPSSSASCSSPSLLLLHSTTRPQSTLSSATRLRTTSSR